MAPTSKAGTRQMGTWSRNKSTHPGNISKPAPRRTSAEVQQEREAKAKAKADREEAKKRSIVRTAEFERADLANEDMVDATPRPPFTPKSWPPSRDQKKAEALVSIEDSSEVEARDDSDFALGPVASEDQSNAEDESSDEATPPAKKLKIQATEKAAQTVGASQKVAERERKVSRDEEVVVNSDEDQTPKPKKTKIKVRDEINFAAQKMENDSEVKRNKYADMVKSTGTSSYLSGMPALQLQATGGELGRGRKLRREGAIADITALNNKVIPAKATPANPDQNDNMTQNDDLMDIDNR